MSKLKLFSIVFAHVALVPSLVMAQAVTPDAAQDISGWVQILLQVLPGLFSLVLLPLAGWAVNKLVAYLDRKGKDLAILRATSVLTTVVSGVVASMAQGIVNDLKEAAADGKLTAAEKDAIKQNAIAEAKRILDPESWKALKDAFGSSAAEALIENEIEKSVVGLRVVTPEKAKATADVVKTVEDAESGN